jgi:hypothetical protein
MGTLQANGAKGMLVRNLPRVPKDAGGGMLKSIGVVVGSYILSMLLVFASDPLLSKIFPGDFVKGHVPSTNPLLASTACFIVISILCAAICARLAPSNPGKHVLWFFVLGEAMGLVFTITGWNSGWPHWYSISWMISWPITSWVGLALGGRKGGKASAAAA